MRVSSLLFSGAIGLFIALSFLSFAPLSADVIPPGDVPFGQTYGEWGGDWWNWAVQEPNATSPLTDDTGEDAGRNQAGPVWFLAGNFGGTSVRDITVPEGKALFFSVINAAWWTPEDGATEAEVRAAANASIDAVSVLWASVDGVQVLDLPSLRAESPAGGFVLNVPAGSILDEFGGAAPGDHDPTVADGFWVMLEPLPVGNHVINFVGAVGNPMAPDFELDVTYNIFVPEPSTLVLLGMGALALTVGWRRRRRTA